MNKCTFCFNRMFRRIALGLGLLLIVFGVTPAGAQPNTTVIPYLGTGYKYKLATINGVPGFESPGFSDANWSTGNAGFGRISTDCPINTTAFVKTLWSNSADALLRKHFTLPPGSRNLTVGVAFSKYVRVFLNGRDISGGLRSRDGCAERNSLIFNAPDSLLLSGDNLIAVRGRDGNDDLSVDNHYKAYLDIEVRADIQQNYTITASATSGGTISPSGAVSVVAGTNQSFTVSPSTGHHIDSVRVDGVNQGAIGFYTFTAVTANHTIAAYFSINKYAIIATASAGGSISPSGTVMVNHGSNQLFTISPNAGYHIDSVRVDGVNQGAVGSYTFTGVTAGHTIAAYFSINAYTIIASASAGGSISPSGTVMVNHGSNQGFTISPGVGYHIDSVRVDGTNQGAIGSYSFTSVTANHTIAAYFSINTYTITSSAGANGSISPNGVVGVSYGGTRAYSILPATGYHVDSVLVDGVKVDSTSSYTFTNVVSNHTIRAVFAINQYTIIASAGANGTISPSGSIGVNHGASASFTITPDLYYYVQDVLVDGASVGAMTSFDFTNITASHTISASFYSTAAVVASLADTGAGTLREAINITNQDPDLDTIKFSFPGNGVRTITLTSSLPIVIDSLVIDGFTQPLTLGENFSPEGSSGPLIELNGNGVAQYGLIVAATNVTVRGLIINRCVEAGILVTGNKATIEGNYIGTDATGTLDLGNGLDGIRVNGASQTRIGSAGVDGPNLLSGNNRNGIRLENAIGTIIESNLIGTEITGQLALGNGGDGIAMVSGSTGNTVGTGNAIAFNAGNGVTFQPGLGNAVLENSIFDNAGLGIDVGSNGVSQSGIVLSVAAFDLKSVAGSFSGAPSSTYRLEFFESNAPDPSGFGEGRKYLGNGNVTTDSTGSADFYLAVPGQMDSYRFVTATATDGSNSTSEFSGALQSIAKVKVYGDHYVVNTTFSGTPLHWDEGNATFRVSTNVPSPYRPSVINGYGTWSNLPQVLYSYGGTTDTTTWGGDADGVNNDVWVASGWNALTGFDSNTIAVTRVRYNTLTGEITDADIAFNAEHFSWDETGTIPTAMDVQNTATHEIGHFGGLGDIYDPGEPGYVSVMGSGNLPVTMFGLIARGETSKRTLETPDSAGIGYIYSHIPASRMDLMLVFDGSTGFSTTYNGFGPAKNSSIELVERLRNGDRIGVVKMPGTVVFPLTAMVDSATRAQASAAINSLVSGGTSAIGSGLQTAQTQLSLSPLANHGTAMILFSAGEETAAPGALSVLPSIIAANTKVFTLGFQGSSGQALSSKIADSTGGTYYLAADTTIPPIVNQIWNLLSGQQQTFYAVASSDTFRNVPQPGLQWQGPVDRGTTSILPGLQWQGPRGSSLADAPDVLPTSFVLSLLAPGGSTIIDSAYVAQHPELGIEFFSGPTFQFFKINNPIPGLWTLFAYGRTVPDENEPVVLSITAFTDITMAVATDQTTYQPDQTIQMSVALSEGGLASGDPHVTGGGGPITDATVIARVKPPDPDSAHTVALNHTTAGMYAGSFGGTHVPGTYGITFIADKDTIERSAIEAVFVVPPPPPPAPNLIVNPGFEAGTAPWVFFTNGTGSYQLSAPGASGAGSAAKLIVNTTGNNTQFQQYGIALIPNTQYTLSFKARSLSGHDLSVNLHRHDAPYTSFGVNNWVVNLTNVWTTFSITFTSINFPPPTPSNARLRFALNGFATAGDQYFIDDVSLQETGGGPAPAAKIRVETASDGSGNVVPSQTFPSGTAITVYAISRDAADNFLANVSATWSLQNITGNVALGDLVPSGDNKRAVFTGNQAGSANIKASLGALTSVQSGLITVIPPPPPVTNLLVNGGFESGTSNWSFSTNGSGTFTTVSPGFVGTKAAQLAISLQGTIVQLYQTGISLTSGSNYRLSFKARCNTGHDLQVSLFKHGAPFTLYGLNNIFFNLTNVFASYSVDFTASGFAGTVNDARFRFWVAPYDKLGDLYFFDDVKLELLPAPPDAETPNLTSQIPTEFTLSQNFPNPFNPSTTIVYELPIDAHVSLEVFNLLGQRVAQLVDGTIAAGYHDAVFNAGDLASGMYFYRITAAGSEGVLFSRTEKMLLTK